MVMVPTTRGASSDAVRAGLASGEMTESASMTRSRRILRVKFEMGLFEHPMPPAGPRDGVGLRAPAERSPAGRQPRSRCCSRPARRAADRPSDAQRPAGRRRRRRHRHPVGRLDAHLAGRARATSPRHDPARGAGRRAGPNAHRRDRTGPSRRARAPGRGIVVVAEPPYAEGAATPRPRAATRRSRGHRRASGRSSTGWSWSSSRAGR